MTIELVLDVDRYRAEADPGLASTTLDWLCRIAPAAKDAGGGMVTHEGATLVRSIRWIDGQCEMQLLVDPTEIEQLWWVPPEPPPAELMRYAEQATW